MAMGDPPPPWTPLQHYGRGYSDVEDAHYRLVSGWHSALAAMDADILRRCTKIRVKAWRQPNEDRAHEVVILERLAIQCRVLHLIREPAHIEMLRAAKAQ